MDTCKAPTSDLLDGRAECNSFHGSLSVVKSTSDELDGFSQGIVELLGLLAVGLVGVLGAWSDRRAGWRTACPPVWLNQNIKWYELPTLIWPCPVDGGHPDATWATKMKKRKDCPGARGGPQTHIIHSCVMCLMSPRCLKNNRFLPSFCLGRGLPGPCENFK